MLVVDITKAWSEEARQAAVEARKARDGKKENPKGQRMSRRDQELAHSSTVAEVSRILSGYKYKDALSRPTGKGGKGWAYADKDSMQAMASQSLGLAHAMTPERIYEWGNKYGVDLQEDYNKLRDLKGPLMERVLGDKPLQLSLVLSLEKWEGSKKARARLAGAQQAEQAGKPGGAYGPSRLQISSLKKERKAIEKQRGVKNVENKEQAMEDGVAHTEKSAQSKVLSSTSLEDSRAVRLMIESNEQNQNQSRPYGMGARDAEGTLQAYTKQKVRMLANKQKEQKKQKTSGLGGGELVEDK